MRHTVRLHGVIVGHSDLEHVEPSSGRAWGAFRAGLGYDLVQPVFRLFSQAVSRDGVTTDADKLSRYHAARDALRLSLENDTGQPIKASAIHIADYTAEEGPTAIALDVLISDEDYWRRRTVSE